jgi:hypothetical protein
MPGHLHPFKSKQPKIYLDGVVTLVTKSGDQSRLDSSDALVPHNGDRCLENVLVRLLIRARLLKLAWMGGGGGGDNCWRVWRSSLLRIYKKNVTIALQSPKE